MINKKKVLSILTLLIPPLLVMAVLLYAYHANELYPFGKNTVSWCDMNQQVVPLMTDFKDILDGKSSMFMNFENAGGMNFWGVFFFFLASPFTLLVKFVDKENIILFVNILVMLKLMLSSFTAMVYFRVCHKKLSWEIAAVLSVMYGFCGYGMLYYQNVIWLDMMYLLPLLIMALKTLVNKGKFLSYTAVLTAMVVVNYYISYMIVVFLLLFIGIYVYLNLRNRETAGEVCVRFFAGSALAALLSAVVWLPSFLQYRSSARGRSILTTIAESKFITSYDTIMPLIYCSAFVMVAVLINVIHGRHRTKQMNLYLYMFILTLIPIFIEPINKMWHTGNYMSFPGRYGFITVFMGLICCAYYLSDSYKTKSRSYLLGTLIIPVIAVFVYLKFTDTFIEKHFDDMINYVKTLWGDQESWLRITELFIITAACYTMIYMLYRKGLLVKRYFAILICFVALLEGYSNTKLYITAPAAIQKTSVSHYQSVLDLSDQIEDDSFYRVKTSSKLFDYNYIGSMGYPSISHYTSLTNKDYMFAMKRLGYTSVWMEAGSSGGTDITDSILSIGYEISHSYNEYNSVYENDSFSINKMPLKAGLGLITSKDLSDKQEIPEVLERSQVQQYLYSSLFDNNEVVTKYAYMNKSDTVNIDESDKYTISGTGNINYTVYINGKQKLYFDCFDQLTTNLSEPIYDSFSVNVNGYSIENSYPYNTNNGLLYLGEYEDQQVNVDIGLLKTVSCQSFGLFSVNEDAFGEALSNSRSINFIRDKGSLYGSCTGQKGQTCFLSIPYDTGLNIKINGKSVDYQKTFSAFVSFPLEDGDNEITITYMPNGFVPGLVLTIIGAAITALYIKFGKKIKLSEKITDIAFYTAGGLGIIVLCIIYVAPVLLNIFKN